MVRPCFRPTARQRRRVELLVGNISEEEIARLLGIARGTLRVHFAFELAYGRERMLAVLLERLDAASRKGSVAATTYLLKRLTQPHSEHDQLGKKEKAQVASETAAEGTTWTDYVH